MIIAIGNAPSSGSTFLADLLDSLPFAVCGPEINLFSVKSNFTNFAYLKKYGFSSSRSALIYQRRQRLLDRRLCSYGIDRLLLNTILDESSSLKDFSINIFAVFSSLRGKQCKLFFEKTPQNIHCAKVFLDTFEDSFFLHIVRNPLYVYKSLLKRNFPPYIAVNTWLIDESRSYELINHPRFITIYYEDLVKEPFIVVCNFLKQINIEYDPHDLEARYKNNEYRKMVSRKMKSWSFNQYGMMGNANKNKIITSEDLNRLCFMLQSKVSKSYSREFGIPEAPFDKLVEIYSYHYKKYIDELKTTVKPNSLYEKRSAKQLFIKYLIDLKHGQCKLKSLFSYMKPVELNNYKCVE